MFSTLRTRFGIPGVISVMALVFAMFGGAYAASNSSDGGTATASKAKKGKAKAKRGPRGPKGATGPAGPAGTAGPAGPAGPQGAKGDAGSNGSNGSSGAAGQSVTTEVEPPLGNCGDQEGVKVTSSSGTNYVCNGANGQNGQSGFTETLPAGKTEKGTWSVGGSSSDTSGIFSALSFNIPLAGNLDAAHAIYVPSTGPNPDPTHCDGNATAPKAASGYLCVYEQFSGNVTFLGLLQIDGATEGASAMGAMVFFSPLAPADPENEPPLSAVGFGSWAVTG